MQQLMHLTRDLIDIAQQRSSIIAAFPLDLCAKQRKSSFQLLCGRLAERLPDSIAVLQAVKCLVERIDDR